MRIVGRAKEVATYVGISLDVMFDGEGTHMSRPNGCDGGMGKMRVQLLAGEKTSRDVASCVGKRQERRVMLPSGVESEDSADTNAEEDAGQMWRGVDGVRRGERVRISPVQYSGAETMRQVRARIRGSGELQGVRRTALRTGEWQVTLRSGVVAGHSSSTNDEMLIRAER